jgi:hypothetical protein
MQCLAVLYRGHAPDRSLTGRASILIAARDIAEVAFVEQSLGHWPTTLNARCRSSGPYP